VEVIEVRHDAGDGLHAKLDARLILMVAGDDLLGRGDDLTI
jgi:hypothetical protein